MRCVQDFALQSFRDKLAKSEGSRQGELDAEASMAKLNEKVIGAAPFALLPIDHTAV